MALPGSDVPVHEAVNSAAAVVSADPLAAAVASVVAGAVVAAVSVGPVSAAADSVAVVSVGLVSDAADLAAVSAGPDSVVVDSAVAVSVDPVSAPADSAVVVSVDPFSVPADSAAAVSADPVFVPFVSAAPVFAADAAAPQVFVCIAPGVAVSVPAAVVAAVVYSSGHPRFFVFPNSDSCPSSSSSAAVVGEESARTPSGVHTNYGLCSTLSNPGPDRNKNVAHSHNKPNPGRNNVSGTSGLPRDATTSHSRKTALPLYQEQRTPRRYPA